MASPIVLDRVEQGSTKRKASKSGRSSISLLGKTTQIYFRNKWGMYQRAYVAIPSNSTTHQSTSTVRIQALYLVMRNFSGKTLVPADSKMYSPASSVTV